MPNTPLNPGLIKPAIPVLMNVEDAKHLTPGQMSDLFRLHINPGQYHFLKLLGFHEIFVRLVLMRNEIEISKNHRSSWNNKNFFD